MTTELLTVECLRNAAKKTLDFTPALDHIMGQADGRYTRGSKAGRLYCCGKPEAVPWRYGPYMAVTLDDVRKVAQLARLSFSPEEERRLIDDLNRMLDYVAALDELDTSNVAPTAHVLPITNVFRNDRERPSLSQEEALANAPSSGHGHFRVPRVID